MLNNLFIIFNNFIVVQSEDLRLAVVIMNKNSMTQDKTMIKLNMQFDTSVNLY